jgi:hypothetical protein
MNHNIALKSSEITVAAAFGLPLDGARENLGH